MAISAKELEEARKKWEEALKKSKSWEGEVKVKTFSRALESDYFWIRDYLTGPLGYELWRQDEEKAASVFSTLFGEMSQRKQALEKRVQELFSTINAVVQSIIRILYDLREYDRFLAIHEDLKSKNPKKREAALITAKRIFMDEVDVKKGRGSINVLSSSQYEFLSLRDLFLKAKGVEDVDKFDANDRVKRILKDRVREFFDWLPRWEKQLRQQKNLLLSYLKSQYGSLKLYIQWAEPYLRAIRLLGFSDKLALEKKLIGVFDTNVIRIELMGKDSFLAWEEKIKERGGKKYVPKKEDKLSEDRKYRLYGPKAFKLLRVELNFASKPTVISQEPGGRSYRQFGELSVKISAHGFDEKSWEEFEKLKDKIEVEEENLLIQAITGGSLKELRDEIEKYIGEFEGEIKKEEEKKKEVKRPPLMFVEIIESFKKNFKVSAPKESKKVIFPKWKIEEAKKMAKDKAKEDGKDLYGAYKKRHDIPG